MHDLFIIPEVISASAANSASPVLATSNFTVCWESFFLDTDYQAKPLVDVYLIFEKSSCKNQVQQTGFLVCKNQFQNWFLQAIQAVKIKFELD